MRQNMNDLLKKGVVDVLVRENLEKKIQSGKKLRVKFGIDPTGSELHLGHAVPLKKMREFQDRGDTVILLIGDYTARIGDPTGKSETRVMLSDEQIQENMKSYIEQASKIIDVDRLEIRYNSEWFAKMTMADIIDLVSKKTVNQLLQREDFRNRFKNDEDISVVEFLYPIMQGYDSVMLESDVEIGGTDQIFNMLVGRDLQKRFESKVIQDVITCPILEGLDGVEKMSKSYNNYISLTDFPSEMFGKTMSIPDSMIIKYFELTTMLELEEIEDIKKQLESGENPRDLKMRLGRELVSFYHSAEDAKKAEIEFIEIFRKGGVPEDIELKSMPQGNYNIVDLVAETGLSVSKSEARRLVQGGGVKVNEKKVESIDEMVGIKEEILLQVGKRKFLKVICDAK
jgi:tyrosyl-tRNA synthetase